MTGQEVSFIVDLDFKLSTKYYYALSVPQSVYHINIYKKFLLSPVASSCCHVASQDLLSLWNTTCTYAVKV